MIFIIYTLLVTFLYAQAEFTDTPNTYEELTTLGVTREDYIPRNRFKAAYMIGNDPATTNVMAHFDIKSKRPTINLDNFKHIKSLDCSSESITVTFDDPKYSKKAVKKWGDCKNLAVYIGHEHECQGTRKVVTAAVDRLEAHGVNLTMHTTFVDADQVIDSYELHFAHGAQNSPGMPGTKLEKRSIGSFFSNIGNKIKDGFHKAVDKVVDTAKDVGNKIKNAVHSDWDKTGVIPFDINYDKDTRTVKKPRINVMDNSKVKLDCVNCYTNGSTIIELHIKATLFVVTEYTLAINGELHANMDLDLTIKATDDTFALRLNMFAIPLSPFTIPGVFNFGPEVRIDTGLTYATKEDLNLQFGFDFNIPFNLKLHSPKGFFSLPEVTKGSNPTAHGHKFNHTKDIEVAVGAHFIPGLYLDMTVFNQKIVALGVVMDSSVGVIVSTGKFAKCPSHAVDVSLYTEHEIRAEFDALTYHKKWPIIGTGKIPVANLTPCSDRPPNFNAIPVLEMNSTRTIGKLDPIPTFTSVSPTSTTEASKTTERLVPPTLFPTVQKGMPVTNMAALPKM